MLVDLLSLKARSSGRAVALFFPVATNFTFRGWKRLLVTWWKQWKSKRRWRKMPLGKPKAKQLSSSASMVFQRGDKNELKGTHKVWFWNTAHYIFAWWFQGKPYGRAYKLHHIHLSTRWLLGRIFQLNVNGEGISFSNPWPRGVP